MPHRLRATCVAVLLAGVSFVAAAPAQTSREAEQKLQRVRSELKSIAQERRKLEGERGAASRQLREADEKVGRTSRSLAETEAADADDKRALLECACGEPGCWPLLATVTVGSAQVIWSGFEQPHRRADSAGGHWDYGGFGPFVFERAAYDAALRPAV